MKSTAVILAMAMILPALSTAPAQTLAEQLGFRKTDKLLIVNGDDAGMCHTANEATMEALEQGLMTTATIMVPCPWFLEIAEYAARHPERDFGVHLCHTSEWKSYRWGPVAPVAQVPGLVDPQGYLWRSEEEVYAHATPEQALIEARAQIKKALAAGVDVTHLDSHMGTLQLHPAYVEVYLRLAVEFDLPVRMASQATMEKFNQPNLRSKFAKEGIVFTDDFVYEELKDEPAGVSAFWQKVLKKLRPGVTELYIHAGKPTDELKAITGSWRTRSEEFDVFTHQPELHQIVKDEQILLIGYRPLRELQRKSHPAR